MTSFRGTQSVVLQPIIKLICSHGYHEGAKTKIKDCTCHLLVLFPGGSASGYIPSTLSPISSADGINIYEKRSPFYGVQV